jgi:nucleotide-binding universal stress UspA family protein
MPKTILAAIDLSHDGDGVLESALGLARLQAAKLAVVTVHPPVPQLVETFLPDGFHQKADAEALAALAARLEAFGVAAGDCRLEVRTGAAYDQVIAFAREIAADLVVIGSHTATAADYLLGSTAAKIVRHAPCSVYVVRREGGGRR